MFRRLCQQTALLVPRVRGRLVHRGASSPTSMAAEMAERSSPKTKYEALALQVTPEWSLTDESLYVALSGFERGEPVTLHSSVTENKMTFAAVGHYVTDDSGNVDTTRDASIGGNYVGVEPMGLIWGMEQAPGQRSGLRLLKKEITDTFKVSLNVHRGHLGLEELCSEAACNPLLTSPFQRSYLAEGVQRIPVTYGKVRGTLFLPEGPGPFPGVIDMFGSVGGIVEMRSALLASRGIAALALPYFKYQDLPKDHKELHIEYFEEATKFLRVHPQVSSNKGIGVMGTSKGCDIALAMAEFIPDVRAVVAINGVCYSIDSNLKHKGKTVKRAESGDRGKLIFLEGGTIACMENAIPWEIEEENMLHIEKSDAAFLFITSLDDQCVHPKASSVGPNRLRKHGKTNVEHLQLPGAGHLVEPPYNPHFLNTFHRFNFGGVLLRWGGERRAHARAQVKAWRKVLEFFREKLM
ncbi:peroxisomal succinyl-coenzyme A thioesterase-like [Lineus longissimus]|uniref:peroxisomal succinyl-coenzyme A thioesterase-like n=1 Tax=Lineus longissimus TaxID=88925 RepID=UPI002B4F9FF1